jgi:hypothetical protein
MRRLLSLMLIDETRVMIADDGESAECGKRELTLRCPRHKIGEPENSTGVHSLTLIDLQGGNMHRFRFSLVAMACALTFLLGADSRAQTMDRAGLAKEIQSLREQLQQKEQEFLAPSAEDRAAFAEFLRQPDTGLIRLLPREKYNGKLMINGSGAYYSFIRLTNEYGFGSDIGLEQSHLSVGFAGADWGYLTKLGDVPLETATLDHPAVQFLATLDTPLQEPGAREQQRLSSSGVTKNGSIYIDRVPAQANTTYVLRSVNYRDSDVLVAVRVIRQDTDGSMVLLWKMLKQFPTPILKP